MNISNASVDVWSVSLQMKNGFSLMHNMCYLHCHMTDQEDYLSVINEAEQKSVLPTDHSSTNCLSSDLGQSNDDALCSLKRVKLLYFSVKSSVLKSSFTCQM